ncbi:hypothetical protein DEO72_LG10g1652 [Vigna unguiculata]|uniref:Uncharacterized protein n=1 Tax=Vigna unguiculata TaxID=3917 RepID=A0A4D6NBY8_VIGUN|nr:hypothetical protein DEO72_LG10g1652 [Vigna unguiculata]
MNLPTHGTTSSDPSIASLLKTQHKHKSTSAGFSPDAAPSAARRNQSRPPGGTFPPPGASTLPNPTIFQSPPGGAHLDVRRYAVHGPLMLVLSLGALTRAARRYTSGMYTI